MDLSYPPRYEPATPDYVLAVLRDQHRQQCHYDCVADPDAILTFETTVADWVLACDLVGWRELGRALNQEWGIDYPDATWHTVLKPAKERRLRDVCTLIAERARRPRIRPTQFLGRPCTAAGVFLTVRSILAEAGATADQIAPSTPLAEYTRRHPLIFLLNISR